MTEQPQHADAASTARLLASGTIGLAYRKWNWGEGVAQYGLVRAAQLLESEPCLDEVGAYIHANGACIPATIDHVMPALPALLYYETTGDEAGLVLATRVIDMLRTHPRSRDGAFIATPIRTVWIDYIYETVPFLLHYDRVVGSAESRQWAIEQVIAYLLACWNSRDGLFAHVYYDTVDASTPFYWARSNAWAALGIVEILQLASSESALRPILTPIFKHLIESVLQYQTKGGLWATVIQIPDTSCEVSAGAMLSLALHQAARLGWISNEATRAADNAWEAVRHHIGPHGTVDGVSAETPPGDAEHYQSIPLGLYPWGQGFALLAALERAFGAAFDTSNLLNGGTENA